MMGIFDRSCARVERQARLMGAMMEELGVDYELASQDQLGIRMAHAARSCLMCGQADTCALWLQAHRAGTNAEPTFCPNRHFFALYRQPRQALAPAR